MINYDDLLSSKLERQRDGSRGKNHRQEIKLPNRFPEYILAIVG